MKSEWCEKAERWWGYAARYGGWLLWKLCMWVKWTCTQCGERRMGVMWLDLGAKITARAKELWIRWCRDLIETRAGCDRVAVVELGMNNGSGNCWGCFGVKVWSDIAKFTNAVVAGFGERWDLIGENEASWSQGNEQKNVSQAYRYAASLAGPRHTKFGECSMCGSGDMFADTPTDTFILSNLSTHLGWSDVTESMVTIRTPFWGYNTT